MIHISTNPNRSVITWLAKGDGTFNVVDYVSGGDACLQDCGTWQAGDVNGDGNTDLIHITTNPGDLRTWFSKGDGTFSVVQYANSGDTCLQACGTWQAGDVNGDGKTDMIHLTTNPGDIRTWLSKGDGTFDVVSYLSSGDMYLQGCGTWQAGDVNGDGKTDLIHIKNDPGNATTWLSAP